MDSTFCHAAFSRRQFNPYLKGAWGNEVEQWQSGAGHIARLLNVDASLFDYLDPEECRIYNDLARHKRFEELESERTKQRDRRIGWPLTNLMQE